MDFTKIFIEKLLYPAMELKNGNKVRKKTKELSGLENISREELDKYREEKLRKLLKTCIKDVKAYSDVNISEEEIEAAPFEALKKFPVTRKQDVVRNKESYVNDKYDRAALIENNTGGSTGEPLKFYMDRDNVEYYEAARFRGLSWYGITNGSRSVMVWGNPLEMNKNQEDKYKQREKLLKNRIMIPAYNMKPDMIDSYVELINSYKPEYIYGYSSILDAMAQMMLDKGLKLNIKLKAVVSTSETLTDQQREHIAKAFYCKVVNEYGARDAGILGYECPCGEMHVIEENAIIEVLDPKTLEPLKDGESGLLAITDITNFAMPRLRYILGDVGSISEQKCKCGRVSRVFSSIDGREDALLVKKDGTLMHGHIINHYAKIRKSIKQFKFVQKSIDLAELSIVKKEDAVDDSGDFIDDVKNAFPGIELKVEFVDSIAPGKSGKIRYTIREFPIN